MNDAKFDLHHPADITISPSLTEAELTGINCSRKDMGTGWVWYRLPAFQDGEIIVSIPDALDSIELAAYRRQKARKGKRIASSISLAFSRPCFEPWGLYLQNASDWCELLLSIPKAFSDDRVSGTIEKLALWRTDDPTFQTSIRLTEAEVRDVLEATGLSKMEHLAFGAGWRSADELPRTLILSKVLPNILRSLASAEIDLTVLDLSPIVNLSSWHIGRD
ncbi:hypothetical protein WJ542_24005 [Paraburkholderia sp. B3]|uniref:hypothetical protein n=1 Tax=Paraburkholderia sp. B3 TaxID=3134791 RepID=UPI003982A4C2